jgi:hypothetical protein
MDERAEQLVMEYQAGRYTRRQFAQKVLRLGLAASALPAVLEAAGTRCAFHPAPAAEAAAAARTVVVAFPDKHYEPRPRLADLWRRQGGQQQSERRDRAVEDGDRDRRARPGTDMGYQCRRASLRLSSAPGEVSRWGTLTLSKGSTEEVFSYETCDVLAGEFDWVSAAVADAPHAERVGASGEDGARVTVVTSGLVASVRSCRAVKLEYTV